MESMSQVSPSWNQRSCARGSLFTDDKSAQVINREKVISFQPNTIVYAVPADSDIGKRVKTATTWNRVSHFL